MSLRRLGAVARKEILHIVRDPRNLFLVTISPAFLLLLLSYVFSFDVTQVRLAVLDHDHSALSRRYLAALTADQDLLLVAAVSNQDEILPLLAAGEIDAGLIIPPGFAHDIQGGRTAAVQALVDGTDPFAGGQAVAALETRSAAFAAVTSPAGAAGRRELIDLRSQAWYNAGLKSLLSMVPGLMPIVLIMPTMAFALALAREKETGTLEGLMATPVKGSEYLVGKLIAYITTAELSAVLAFLVAVLWFKVPFRGDLGIYLLLTADYFLACMGAALVITHFVKSQQTTMLVVLLVFLVPSFFLSGLISPVSRESLRSLLTSYALPSTHFVQISRVTFLKGLGLAEVAQPALILLGMAAGALAAGLSLFRKKVA